MANVYFRDAYWVDTAFTILMIAFLSLVGMFTLTAINQVERVRRSETDSCVNSAEDRALKAVLIICGMMVMYFIGLFFCNFYDYCVAFKSWMYIGGLIACIATFGLSIHFSLDALERGTEDCGKDDYSQPVRRAVLCASFGLLFCLIYTIFIAHNWYRGASPKVVVRASVNAPAGQVVPDVQQLQH